MVKHGLLTGTSEAPRLFSWAFDKTFERWKTNHQKPPSMMLPAPFAGMEGLKVDGSWSGFADDLFIKDELPDHTEESSKHIILNNATSLDETPRGGQTYKIFVSWRSCQVSADIGEQRHLTSLVPFGKILGRARYLGGRYSFNGSNKAEIECRLQAMAPNWQIVPQRRITSSTHGPEALAKQAAAT